MLDFRVDTFLAVCRCMSFTRAAAALHITQPAVSQHIRALEAQYGVRFFSFEGKKLTLTDAGRLFLRTATTMRHDAQHLRDALGSLSGGGRRLVFGARDPKSGCFGSVSDFNALAFNHKPQVVCGVRGEECAQILSAFFQKLRRGRQ